MFAGNEAHYFSVGRDAVELIQRMIAFEPKRILDMPSGHGRVTRSLTAAYPDAELHVCDIDQDAVDFCASTFNVTPHISSRCFDRLNLAARFDLIWAGSLITHLRPTDTKEFLRFVMRHLATGGVAIISSHGHYVADLLSESAHKRVSAYGLPAETLRPIVNDCIYKGYGFVEYPGMQDYGISIISPSWLRDTVSAVGGKTLSYHERAWGQHHDCIAIQQLLNLTNATQNDKASVGSKRASVVPVDLQARSS